MASLALLVIVLTGAMIAAQPVINAALARELGSPVVAVIVSLTVSTLCMLPFLLVHGARVRTETLAAAPWWIWTGGVAGAALVSAGLMLAPRIGVAFFLVALVTGQLVAGALIDRFGLFGVTVREIDGPRILGLALVVAGLVVYRFGRF